MEVILGLVGFITYIFVFIALMCTWSNTGKTAELVEKFWLLTCEDGGRDPKTGKKLEKKEG